MAGKKTLILTPQDKSAMENALRVARERYLDNRKMLLDLQKSGGNALVTKKGAGDLAEQFHEQGKDANVLLSQLIWADEVRLEGDPEQEEQG